MLFNIWLFPEHESCLFFCLLIKLLNETTFARFSAFSKLLLRAFLLSLNYLLFKQKTSHQGALSYWKENFLGQRLLLFTSLYNSNWENIWAKSLFQKLYSNWTFKYLIFQQEEICKTTQSCASFWTSWRPKLSFTIKLVGGRSNYYSFPKLFKS